MKLWQKLALTSLLFVVLAVQLTQFLMLERNFESELRREKDAAVADHAAISAALANRVDYARVKAGRFFLSEEETDAVLLEAVREETFDAPIAVLKNGEPLSVPAEASVRSILEGSLAPIGAEIPSGGGLAAVVSPGASQQRAVAVVSPLALSPDGYRLLTVRDVTAVFEERSTALPAAGRNGLLIGCCISAALVLLLFVQLHPLRVSVKTIREIAGGNYALAPEPKGSDELRTLQQSINDMAGSIREREDRLRAIADSRKRFADAMAHEMKTPLTSILGFADILRIKRVVSDAERRDFASMIVDEAKRLRGLSAKLLQLASTDHSQLDLADVPVESLFLEVQSAMLPALSRRGLKLETAHQGAVIRVDRELFLSLLYNLVDNAAKASPDGATVWLVQGAVDGRTVLSVIDRGIGMKPDTVRHATEAFYMEDKARSRKAGGAGLGLSLCEDICRRHGARLEIRSKYKEGTTVVIHMDAAPKEPERAPTSLGQQETSSPKNPVRAKARGASKRKSGKRRHSA